MNFPDSPVGCATCASWGTFRIPNLKSLHDFMFVLNGSKPGQTLTARIKRDGKIVEVPVTFDERPPR